MVGVGVVDSLETFPPRKYYVYYTKRAVQSCKKNLYLFLY